MATLHENIESLCDSVTATLTRIMIEDVPEIWDSPVQRTDALQTAIHSCLRVGNAAHKGISVSKIARLENIPINRVQEILRKNEAAARFKAQNKKGKKKEEDDDGSFLTTKGFNASKGLAFELVMADTLLRLGVPLDTLTIHAQVGEGTKGDERIVEADLLTCLRQKHRLNRRPMACAGHYKTSSRERHRQVSLDAQQISGRLINEEQRLVLHSIQENTVFCQAMVEFMEMTRRYPEHGLNLTRDEFAPLAEQFYLFYQKGLGQELVDVAQRIQDLMDLKELLTKLDELKIKYFLRQDLRPEHVEQVFVMWREYPDKQTASAAIATTKNISKQVLGDVSIHSLADYADVQHFQKHLDVLGLDIKRLPALKKSVPPELRLLPEFTWVLKNAAQSSWEGSAEIDPEADILPLQEFLCG